MSVKFGFLEVADEIEWSSGSIRPLENHAQVVKGVRDSPRHYGDWFYPPPFHDVRKVNSEAKAPPRVQGPFSMPSTHVLELTDPSADSQLQEFCVLPASSAATSGVTVQSQQRP